MSGTTAVTEELKAVTFLSTLLHRTITSDPEVRKSDLLSITPLEVITRAGQAMVKAVGSEGPQSSVGKLVAANLQRAFNEIEVARMEGVPLESPEMNKRLEKYVNSPDMNLLKTFIPKQGNFSLETEEHLREANYQKEPSPQQQRGIIKEYLKVYSPTNDDGSLRTDEQINAALAKQPDEKIGATLNTKIAPGFFGDKDSYEAAIRMAHEHSSAALCGGASCDLRQMSNEAYYVKPGDVINSFNKSTLKDAPSR